jgi:autotransporter translocation and assembly factor TamB
MAIQKYLERSKKIAIASLKSVAVVAAIVVAVVALSIGSAVVVLRTDWGGERVRRQIVKRANQQLLGQLGIGRLSFGGDRLVLWDVSLRDPDGIVVARIARAEVDFQVTRLLHKEVRLTAVALDAPVVTAISDSRGVDLSRAIAPRTKPSEGKPPRPKTKEEGWVIQLGRFDLTRGQIQVTSVNAAIRKDVVHAINLSLFLSLRYATGNGSLDMSLRLNGQNVAAPAGPLLVVAETRVRGGGIHYSLDCSLLGGTIKSRGDLDPDHPSRSDAIAAVAIPQQAVAGFDWGPLHLDMQAHPGTVPVIDLLLAMPGLRVTAQGGPDEEPKERGNGHDAQGGHDGQKDGQDGQFRLKGGIVLSDLARTVKAAQALSVNELPLASGEGRLDLIAAGSMVDAPDTWSLDTDGAFERLRFATTVIRGLSLEGHVAQRSGTPQEGNVHVGVTSVTAGTTTLGHVQLTARLRQLDLALEAGVSAPQPIALVVAGRLDDDHRGLALTRLTLRYPNAEWSSEETARLRSEHQKVSVQNLRLRAKEQRLSLDGAKEGEGIKAHLVLSQFRLDVLPAVLVKPEMKLGGTLDIDVKADGTASNPKVTAQVRLADGRIRNVSKIKASVDASLADQRVDGKLSVEAPIAAIDGEFHLPVAPLAPRGQLDARLNIARINLADALRVAAVKPQADGRLTLTLGVSGSADDPKVDLVLTGRELVLRPVTNTARTVRKAAVDLGHGRIHLTYGERAARGDIDVSFARGGSLKVEAIARVNLSYPRVTEGLVVKRIPVHGKAIARDLDVGWVSQFNEQLQTLGGQVTADAQIAGTVGDPQFIGDVRWKNGKVVTTAAANPTKM